MCRGRLTGIVPRDPASSHRLPEADFRDIEWTSFGPLAETKSDSLEFVELP
jgi:hypothetical protein